MKKTIFSKKLIFPFISAVIAAVFISSVLHVEKGHREEGKAQLEEAVRRAAASCYAAEGAYPPDLVYLEEHYGIRINENYTVIYEVIGSNIMPDITVLDDNK